MALWGWNAIRSLNRVDLGDALSVPTGDVRNYLIVGSDSREGLEPGVANEGAIGLDVTGRRSDTIIVLRLEGERATMMSIPRDLWVRNPATGREGRINATYRDGPANLVRAVTEDLGIPVHHYVEVDFKSFSGMVDAMGGITIDFPYPAYDRGSGLNVLRAGPARLDGSQALAYVRSRHYVEIVDGAERRDPTADLGRQERQQTFIRTTLAEVGGTRNPLTLVRVAAAAAAGTRVDQDFGFGDAVDLARRLGGTTPESVLLPTTPANKGGAAVLLLARPDADAVLGAFGAGG